MQLQKNLNVENGAIFLSTSYSSDQARLKKTFFFLSKISDDHPVAVICCYHVSYILYIFSVEGNCTHTVRRVSIVTLTKGS